jgi:spermidine synthase
LGLLLGNTSDAAAVVLAAYFAGMAIGYAVGGRLANRVCPFRGYAACELIVAAWAIVIPTAIGLANHAMLGPWLHSSDARLQILSRVGFSMLLLGPATIALGATLPMMSEMIARRAFTAGSKPQHAGLTVAYGFNLLGAVCGVLAASSTMLAVVGVVGSSRFAAAVSAICALGALVLRSTSMIERFGASHWFRDPLPVASAEPLILTQSLDNHRFWTIVVAVSGFATLALEVLYTRLFSLIFHNSTYTFSFVLIGFLLGISLGAFIANRWLRRFDPTTLIYRASLLAGISVGASVIGFVLGTSLEYFQGGNSFASYYLGGLLLTLAVTVPVSTFAGMFLPLAWEANRVDGNLSSREIGRLTLINTLAAAGGAIAASFVMFPTLGLWKSFAITAAILLTPTMIRAFRIAALRLPIVTAIAAAISCLPLIFTNPETWVRGDRLDVVLRRWHSSYGWIDVVEDSQSGVKRIQQNLHYRFGATGSNSEREFRQAHLPLLLHPSPRDVLFLGLGTGMTAGGAVPHRELGSIDIVELIREVVPAARILADENRNVVDDPRTRMIVDDARHFLATTPKQYDVIVADLFVPWESETGYLYTVEQFKTTRTRLREGGVFCQWLPLYQLGRADFEMIANSLRRVYPHVTLWWGKLDAQRPVLALVATESSISIDESAMQQRLNNLSLTGQFDDSSLSTSTRLVELYAGDWPLHPVAIINTDEHPWVEFKSPISNRSGDGIRGTVLRELQSDVFEKNAARSMQYIQSNQSQPIMDRLWQRTVLFPEPSPL